MHTKHYFLLLIGLALMIMLLILESRARNRCVGIGTPVEVDEDLQDAREWPIDGLVLFSKKSVGLMFHAHDDGDLGANVVVTESESEIRIDLMIGGIKTKEKNVLRSANSEDYEGGTRFYATAKLSSPIGTRALYKSSVTRYPHRPDKWPLESYVGLSVKQATERAKSDNRKYREIYIDEEPDMMTLDVRTNFYIRNVNGHPTVVGVVTDWGEFVGSVKPGFCHP